MNFKEGRSIKTEPVVPSVTMEVYVDAEVFCWIVNTLNKSFIHVFENDSIKPISLKKRKVFIYKVHVPIQVIGSFKEKNMTTLNLFKLQELI